MIKKIISGGQTGADRAALDVAINLGIPHGGWIPKGPIARKIPAAGNANRSDYQRAVEALEKEP